MTLGKDLGRDLGKNYTNKNIQPSIHHSFRVCCLGISNPSGPKTVYLESHCQGLMPWRFQPRSKPMFHPKREMSDILGNECQKCRLERDLGNNYTNKNIQPSIVYSFWVCCLGISNPSGAYAPSGFRYPGQSPCISRVDTKVLAEVSAGGYTMIMFSLFSLHLSRVKTYKQSILHTTTLG